MNILMLLFKDIHYDARVQREALALAEAGHQVMIACLEEYEEPPPPIHENVQLHRHSLTTKRLKRDITKQNGNSPSFRTYILQLFRNPFVKLIKDIIANQQYYSQLKRLVRKRPVDVIHCHDLNTLPAGSFLARKLGCQLVYDSHELYNEMAGKNPVERQVGYWIEKRFIKRIDHLIVVNPHVSKEFEKRYGIFPTTIIQNTPILPPLKKLETEEVNYWRSHYQLSESDIILLYQGGFTPDRGIEECIQAVQLLPDSYKLILLGDGRIKQHLLDLIKNQNLSNRVYVHGQVPAADILWYTKQAHIGLVMYRNTCQNNYYSTPNKIFEYMLAGIPTVASNHPGKKYIVTEEQTGICVSETPEMIQQGVQSIIKNYDFYRKKCLQKRKHFSWNVEKTKLVETYHKLGEHTYEKAVNH